MGERRLNQRRRSWSSAAAALVALPACATFGGNGEPAGPLARPAESARCEVAKSHDNPLVTEWPSAHKTELEALIRRGAVLVEYSGCSLRVAYGCRTSGR